MLLVLQIHLVEAGRTLFPARRGLHRRQDPAAEHHDLTFLLTFPDPSSQRLTTSSFTKCLDVSDGPRPMTVGPSGRPVTSLLGRRGYWSGQKTTFRTPWKKS